jgi:hypothetical protein
MITYPALFEYDEEEKSTTFDSPIWMFYLRRDV